ncbi:hypothetical protein SDC9_208759 [bioreactor metagenome]|uniref:Uncharacterized protein n=1 Tax=bioreactor metagenome TaxID=1076179 RepID=A0A645JBD8_9ZZZZ
MAGSPETASLHETSDPPESMPERHGRGTDIQYSKNRKFLPSAVEPDRENRKDEAAVEHQSPLIDPEDLQPVALELAVELNHIKQAGSHNAANNYDDSEIENLIRSQSRILALVLHYEQGNQKTCCHTNSIPVNRHAE